MAKLSVVAFFQARAENGERSGIPGILYVYGPECPRTLIAYMVYFGTGNRLP